VESSNHAHAGTPPRSRRHVDPERQPKSPARYAPCPRHRRTLALAAARSHACRAVRQSAATMVAAQDHCRPGGEQRVRRMSRRAATSPGSRRRRAGEVEGLCPSGTVEGVGRRRAGRSAALRTTRSTSSEVSENNARAGRCP
jgi:hypothetical protein